MTTFAPAATPRKRDPFDRSRFYTIEGRELPSVTTILSIIDKSGPLMYWAVNLEKKAFEKAIIDALADPAVKRATVLDKVVECLGGARRFLKEQDAAATIGTAAHARIEWRTRKMLGEKVGDEPVIPDAAELAVMAWEDWAKEVDFTPVCAERAVHCLGCGYAGTIDWIAKVRGVVTLGDYKTSKAIYPEAFLQNVAYRHAADKNGLPTAQGMILRLPKTLDDLKAKDATPFDAMVVPDTPLEDFKAVLRVWQWKRRMEGRTVGSASAAPAGSAA